jgi:hypothetical protein
VEQGDDENDRPVNKERRTKIDAKNLVRAAKFAAIFARGFIFPKLS